MQRRAFHLVLVLGLLATSACELIADFDRSKIPGQDSGAPPDLDASDVDAQADASDGEDAGADEDAGAEE